MLRRFDGWNCLKNELKNVIFSIVLLKISENPCRLKKNMYFCNVSVKIRKLLKMQMQKLLAYTLLLNSIIILLGITS